MPSAVFFDYETKGRVLFGADAISTYVGQTEGRLMRALKSILGSSADQRKDQRSATAWSRWRKSSRSLSGA